jgi:hypothetical protein
VFHPRKSSGTTLLHLEYASCVWNPFYNVRVDRVEHLQRQFTRFALRGLVWTDMHDLPPYEDRCACDVYFRCSEWESELTKLVVRSRFDHITHYIRLAVPILYVLTSIERTMDFMNHCRVRCDSLMRSLVCLISV